MRRDTGASSTSPATLVITKHTRSERGKWKTSDFYRDYFYRHHLDRHKKSHLKATPFVCPICGFKSGRKDNLKQHVEKRHCGPERGIRELELLYPEMYTQHEAAGRYLN